MGEPPENETETDEQADANAALAAQFRAHGEALCAYLAKQIGSRETAEDLTQETFLRIRQAGGWNRVKDGRAYLFACARNVLIDYFRRARVRRLDEECVYNDEAMAAPAPSEEKRLEARADLRRLGAALEALPPRTRKAFMLNRIYRLSVNETAEIMGISPRTVESHVSKGLRLCALKLTGDETEGDGVIDLAARRYRKGNAS